MIFYMLRLFQRMLLALAIVGAANSASAFSLLGPFAIDSSGAVWEVPAIGYNPYGGDIGGPVNLGEEYRWNAKTITYGFDSSFLNYFGTQGTEAVMQAVAMLNNLPAFSQMSSNLTEFPLQTKRMNYQASALYLTDLKSTALALLVEEMGLASPERYVWTLRSRLTLSTPPVTNYSVIMRNFDPVTLATSKYVNGALYTYFIVDPIRLTGGGQFADAVESSVDPLAFTYTAVVSAAEGINGGGLYFGEFFTGLTRDDVGGLRYIYRTNNYNIENLIPGTTAVTATNSSGGSGVPPWTPVGGGGGGGTTNTTVVTNVVVDLALRPGVDKFNFVQAKYDSTFGFFITVTNTYTDTYVTNSTLHTQTVQRVLTQPDILFAAADLDVYVDGSLITATRTTCTAPIWVNNDALNGPIPQSGPGQINGQVVITFSDVGPWIFNQFANFTDEANPAYMGLVWGSFDGTTNPPVVYPIGTSIQDLEDQVLGGN